MNLLSVVNSLRRERPISREFMWYELLVRLLLIRELIEMVLTVWELEKFGGTLS